METKVFTSSFTWTSMPCYLESLLTLHLYVHRIFSSLGFLAFFIGWFEQK